jgi:hypothetical protein
LDPNSAATNATDNAFLNVQIAVIGTGYGTLLLIPPLWSIKGILPMRSTTLRRRCVMVRARFEVGKSIEPKMIDVSGPTSVVFYSLL